jgi:hypothetical protein
LGCLSFPCSGLPCYIFDVDLESNIPIAVWLINFVFCLIYIGIFYSLYRYTKYLGGKRENNKSLP